MILKGILMVYFLGVDLDRDFAGLLWGGSITRHQFREVDDFGGFIDGV